MSQTKAKVKTRPGFLNKEEAEGVKNNSSFTKYHNNNDLSLFDNRVALATEGLQPYFEKMLREKVSKQNALAISEYINSLRREINLSIGYRKANLDTLVALAKFHSNKKDHKP